LHVQKVTGVAGSERHLLTLLPRLDSTRFRPTFLALLEPTAPAVEYLRMLAERGVEADRMWIRCDVDPMCLWELYRYVKRGSFDLVHTHLIHADVYGTLAARLADVRRLVSTRHNDDAFRHNALMKGLIAMVGRRCDWVITISGHLQEWVERMEGRPAERITAIPYGLLLEQPDHARSPRPRSELGLSDASLVAVSVGRLTEQKGHRYLLDAWRTVAQREPGARLLIVGDGPLRAQLTAYAAQLGLGGQVTFTGWRGDVANLLAVADVYVHPSLWEGFGLVLLEAMAAGKPVVASRVSAIPEIVVDGVTGWLVPAADGGALADVVLRLFKDSSARTEMGEAGRRRVSSDFTVERMVKATEEVYARLLSDSAGTLACV
jgi:glycosyltransferase involved in cell wall biosynthesis